MDKLIEGSGALGLELTATQVERFELYFRLLEEWNGRTNLTRIVDYEEVQLKHFLDSLTVMTVLPLNKAGGLKLLDVGAGAGFPGVPLKIACVSISLFLLDSIGKKTEFLEYATRALGLDDVHVLTGRAETLARDQDLRETFDVVVSRAVAPLSSLLELSLPFCKLGGKVIAQKQASYKAEPGDPFKALRALGGRFEEEIPVEVKGLGRDRRLIVVSKVEHTPTRYPRRPGIPVKRPL